MTHCCHQRNILTFGCTWPETLLDQGTVADGWRMQGKTGAAGGVGWYVGWVDKGATRRVFARLVADDDTRPDNLPAGAWAKQGFMRDFSGLVDPLAKGFVK